MDERERWNARYTAQGDRALAAPNAFLRAHLAMLPKGDVLELAMGEGHNAIFLAQHGFSVTGVDISDVAVERALHLARTAGVTIEARQMDLSTLTLPPTPTTLWRAFIISSATCCRKSSTHCVRVEW
jgi:tellurite methyltransferase